MSDRQFFTLAAHCAARRCSAALRGSVLSCRISAIFGQTKDIGQNSMGHCGTFWDIKMGKISQAFRVFLSKSPFFHNVRRPPPPGGGTFWDILGYRPLAQQANRAAEQDNSQSGQPSGLQRSSFHRAHHHPFTPSPPHLVTPSSCQPPAACTRGRFAGPSSPT